MSEITLPSFGLLYDETMELSGGKCHIVDMGTKEEKLLTNASDMVHITSQIIKSCVKQPTIKEPEKLLTSDRLFLLMVIRSLSYGENYTFSIKCPNQNCGFKNEFTKRIPGDFDVKVFEGTETEPFEVFLPKMGKKIGFRLLRGFDEIEINKFRDNKLKKGSKKQEGDPAFEYSLARRIVTVDDETVNLQKAMDLFPLKAYDSSVLRQTMDKVDVGLDLMFNFECPKCENEHKIMLPLTSDFFRADITGLQEHP